MRTPEPHLTLTLYPDGQPSEDALHGGCCLGAYRILEAIDRGQSMFAFAKQTGMAYSKAWRLIKGVEAAFGAQLVTTDGASAHGYKLTDDGHTLVNEYRDTLSPIRHVL